MTTLRHLVVAPLVRRAWPYAIGATLAIGLTVPFAVRHDSWYEWGAAYWLLVLQDESVGTTGLPTYFINHPLTGLYYPHHVFYSGFTLSLLAYVSQVIGTWVTFCAAIAASIMAGYVGMLWLARHIGTTTPIACALATLAVSSPYYLTDIYGKGAWAEFVAVSMLPLLLGSIVRCLATARSGPMSRAGLVGLVVSSAVLAGTHNITLLLSSVFTALIAALLVGVLGGRQLIRHIPRIGAAVAIGVALTGAWLLPNTWLARHTVISRLPFPESSEADRGLLILRPWLAQPDIPAELRVFVQTESLVLAPIVLGLAAVAVAFARRRRAPAERSSPTLDRATAIALLGTALAASLIFALMTQTEWWIETPPFFMRAVPEWIRLSVQFPNRLNPYLTLALLLVLTLTLGRSHLRGVLAAAVRGLVVAVAVWYAALGVYQAVSAKSLPASLPRTHPSDVTAASPPRALVESGMPQAFAYRLTEGVARIETPSRELVFDNARLRRSTALEGRRRYVTNVVWSPLVDVEGATVLGPDAQGWLVLRLPAAPDRREIRIVSNQPTRVLAGWALSGVAGVTMCGVGATWILRRRRPRHHRAARYPRLRASAGESGANET